MCKVLSAVNDLPYHAIDQIQWKPGWVQTSANEYNQAHDSLIFQDRWLLDGFGTWDSILRRMDAADTIIIVDHPIWIHYWWATKRQVKSLFIKLEDVPLGCSMWPATLRLYKMMWRLHTVQRPVLLKEAESRSKLKRYIHISSPAKLKMFMSNPV